MSVNCYSWLFSMPYLHVLNSRVKGIKATLFFMHVVWLWEEIFSLPKLYHCAATNAIKISIIVYNIRELKNKQTTTKKKQFQKPQGAKKPLSICPYV